MREILFRGKRIDNGEWVYGNLEQDIDANTAKITGYDYFVDQDGIKHRKMFYHEVKPETVGQYTGIIDKNYDRIFEHDIMKFCDDDGEESYYKIEWNLYRWTVIDENGNVDDLDNFFCNMSAVVGNIFDNPELLGGD